MKLRALIAAAALAAAPLVLAPAATAQAAPFYTKAGNVAVSGYDTVAYFTEGKPTKGSSQFTATHKGAIFHFASAENRDVFASNPDKYAPQFGGYCAWAVAQGQTASANPNNWAIVDGKLYLNYNDAVQQRWDANRGGFIQQANGTWPSIVGETTVPARGHGSGSRTGGYGS